MLLLVAAAAFARDAAVCHVREKLTRDGSHQYLPSVLAERSF